ncbi:unnamed protein product [Sphagnum troendelagicum]|jgi:hypothetical protein|uniref:Uncharacterized protein n=2 Tax=Sphagnum TaxID=13804 RepID=A0ABP0V2V9_9BRYO
MASRTLSYHGDIEETVRYKVLKDTRERNAIGGSSNFSAGGTGAQQVKEPDHDASDKKKTSDKAPAAEADAGKSKDSG